MISAASPPAMNAATLSCHSGINCSVYCLHNVSRTRDNLPVAPQPQMNTRPFCYNVVLIYAARSYNYRILLFRMPIVSTSISFKIEIAVLRSCWARDERPMVLGFCCSVRRQPSLKLEAILRKSSAVYVLSISIFNKNQ